MLQLQWSIPLIHVPNSQFLTNELENDFELEFIFFIVNRLHSFSGIRRITFVFGISGIILYLYSDDLARDYLALGIQNYESITLFVHSKLNMMMFARVN